MHDMTTKDLVFIARSEGVGPATKLLIRDELLLRSYSAHNGKELSRIERALATIPSRRELAGALR
jgi:hypothetical protein